MKIVVKDIRTGKEFVDEYGNGYYMDVVVGGVLVGYVPMADRYAWESGNMSDNELIRLARQSNFVPHASIDTRHADVLLED